MDEKQRLQEAEAAQMAVVDSTPPPPAYADVEVSVETIEILTEPPTVPAWIKRLPLTLPLAHFMFSVPLALFFARSFGGAVFVCSAVSFWLVASATAGIARATRHDIRLQKAGVRYLGGAGIIMVSWPFLIVMLFAPGRMPCSRKMHPYHHGRVGTTRPYHFHHIAPVATPMHHHHQHHAGTVSSSKGDRVVLAAVGEKLAQMQAYFPNLKAASVRVVVSSKGVKALITEEESPISVAPAPVNDPPVHDAPAQETTSNTQDNAEELR